MIFKAAALLLLPAISFAATSTNAPPRAARSVHLGYSAPEGDVFYNEMIVEQSVNGSYFMACGWDTGYFGIQQLNEQSRDFFRVGSKQGK